MSLFSALLIRHGRSNLSSVIVRSQGTQAQAQTINLAKPCSRPRRVQKLVSAEPTSPCPQRSTSYQPTHPVPVRICRREDLERACLPKFCDCPQKQPPKTMKNYLCEMAVFGAKGAVAAGFIYWTVAEGFWGEPQDTEDMYTRMRETFASNSTLEEASFPRLEHMKFKLLDSYNRAVLSTMGLLVGVPVKLTKQIHDALYPCEPVEEEGKGGKKKTKK
ncbi:uncharacterized protein LOC106647252 [Copidosoma floridanum]|uniref:uncharacterized protein LOC106647252 n=1 Tax=Copidosoma floridanum TaxID=29053 RepID=UPI0006C94821|nr:uncharacterized protein LOC106647252 [Copidosoma floridanum]